MKPYSAACDQNKDVILNAITPILKVAQDVLEIGSGTAQHAIYFAQQHPHLTWHCSDQAHYHAGINAWLNEAGLDNTPAPITLDVRQSQWPTLKVDHIFSANTLHIMSMEAVKGCFKGVGSLLPLGGYFMVYGPFNRHGQFTSRSNQAFDAYLKSEDPKRGIRDLEALHQIAETHGLMPFDDLPMPANNALIIWQKT